MRGHVRKRRTWEFIVDVGLHPVTGGRRQKNKGGFATKKEAESALHEFIRYVEAGGDPCPGRIELAAYLGRWLEFQRVRGRGPERSRRTRVHPSGDRLDHRPDRARRAAASPHPDRPAQDAGARALARHDRRGPKHPRLCASSSRRRRAHHGEPGRRRQAPRMTAQGAPLVDVFAAHGAPSGLPGNRVGDPHPPGHGHRGAPLRDPRPVLV